jgi:threonine dehydratase
MLAVMNGQMYTRPHHLLPAIFVGRCLACGATDERFDASPSARLCQRCNLAMNWPRKEHAKLVTKVPDWKSPLTVKVLPGAASASDFDLFARWKGSESDIWLRPAPDADLAAVQAYLPYSRDFIRGVCRRHCGTPALFRSRRLENWLLSDAKIFVLDMSTFGCSGSLKDPRSWAVLNTAVNERIRHLAVWTAGNAGISLGRLARLCNFDLPPDRQLRVYALYDPSDRSVDRRVEAELRRTGCQVIRVAATAKTIFPPDKIRQSVQNRAEGLGEWNPEAYWDVTDGWEGVGMVMYRLLAAQVVRDLRPTHIIAPLGTGNLMLGLQLGLQDCERAGVVVPGSVQMIGAVPLGENIVLSISRRKELTPSYSRRVADGTPPLMPKIATTYTPLLALIDHELESGRIGWCEVNAEAQRRVVEELRKPAADWDIHSEPSSMATFAALPEVVRQSSGNGKERILVINSGSGLLSTEEFRFVEEPFAEARF